MNTLLEFLNQDGEFENWFRKIIRDEIEYLSDQKDTIDKEFLDIEEISKRLKYSVPNIRLMVANKTIPFHQLPNEKKGKSTKLLFIWSEILNWIINKNKM